LLSGVSATRTLWYFSGNLSPTGTNRRSSRSRLFSASRFSTFWCSVEIDRRSSLSRAISSWANSTISTSQLSSVNSRTFTATR
jgi:hypothetical protein